MGKKVDILLSFSFIKRRSNYMKNWIDKRIPLLIIISLFQGLLLFLDWLDLKCFIPNRKTGVDAIIYFFRFPSVRNELFIILFALLGIVAISLYRKLKK